MDSNCDYHRVNPPLLDSGLTSLPCMPWLGAPLPLCRSMSPWPTAHSPSVNNPTVHPPLLSTTALHAHRDHTHSHHYTPHIHHHLLIQHPPLHLPVYPVFPSSPTYHRRSPLPLSLPLSHTQPRTKHPHNPHPPTLDHRHKTYHPSLTPLTPPCRLVRLRGRAHRRPITHEAKAPHTRSTSSSPQSISPSLSHLHHAYPQRHPHHPP